MKLSKFASLLAIALVLSVATSACRKKVGMVTPLPGSMTKNPSDIGPGKGLGETGLSDTNLSNTPFGLESPDKYANYTKDAEIFKQDTIYFAFDSSVVRPAEKSKAAKVADYLKGNASNALEVDGHCDERGTEEYNRALGERRALAVREELVRLGVDASRVVTKTFGKDMPADTGHNEAAWAKNRRGEFILLTPPK
ncbi:MAG TPA: OmpA family protein [Verrucomicrobiae bacterium]